MDITSKTLALLLVLVCLTSLVMLPYPTVKAQNKTIVVPDDYPTITSAIVNALNGDTVFVKSGTYHELSLVIDKSIWLKGEDQSNTYINLNPKWIEYVNPIPFSNQISHFDNALDVTASDVKISGFTISSNVTSNGGLYLVNGNNTLITGNRIQNNSVFLMGANQVFTLNTVRGSVQCYSSLYNVIAGNNVYGDIWVNNSPEFNVTPHVTNVIYGNFVTDGNGIAVGGDGNIVFNNKVTSSTLGIGIDIYASNCILCGNQIINNDIGLRGASEGHDNKFFGNEVIENRYGAKVANIWGIGENNVFYDNNFVDNSQNVNTDTVIVLTDKSWTAHHGGSFDNGVRGNYWSNYNGTDANGDGLGDLPYVIDAERRDNYPLMAPFNISSVSIDLPAWAAAYSAVAFEEPALELEESPLENQTPESSPNQTSVSSPTLVDVPINPINVVAIVAVAIVVTFVSLLLYRRHQKNR